MKRDTIGIKIDQYDSVATCVKVLRKHTELSIGEIKSKISSGEYILEVPYIDRFGVKRIISCYQALENAGIKAQLFEVDGAPTTITFLRNLNQTYDEISDEVDAEMDLESVDS